MSDYKTRLHKVQAGLKFMSSIGVDRLYSDKVKAFWEKLKPLVDDEMNGVEEEANPDTVEEIFKA